MQAAACLAEWRCGDGGDPRLVGLSVTLDPPERRPRPCAGNVARDLGGAGAGAEESPPLRLPWELLPPRAAFASNVFRPGYMYVLRLHKLDGPHWEIKASVVFRSHSIPDQLVLSLRIQTLFVSLCECVMFLIFPPLTGESLQNLPESFTKARIHALSSSLPPSYYDNMSVEISP